MVGRAEIWKRLAHSHGWQVRSLRNISAAKVPSEECGVHSFPHPLDWWAAPWPWATHSMLGTDKLCSSLPDEPWRSNSTTKVCDHPASGSKALCSLGHLLSGLRPNTGTEFEPVSDWWIPLAFTWWLTENLPNATGVQPEALLVTKPNRQPTGRGRKRRIAGCLWSFADLLPGSVLVKAGLGAQLGFS